MKLSHVYKKNKTHLQDQIRLIRYSAAKQNLYFATTLQNCVQSFSLDDSKLLDSYNGHASPPSVFAISADSRLLLSTSTGPPTIQLHDLSTPSKPILIRPRCSAAAVIAAEFHPQDTQIFVLAFSDGSLAVFNATRILRQIDGEVASLQDVHADRVPSPSHQSPSENPRLGTWTDIVLRKTASIAAVAFVPGYKAMVISVGNDQKCCIVDFTQPDKGKAVLLSSWKLSRPPTSLSVVHAKSTISSEDESIYIAIGCHDGHVLLFDLDGHFKGKSPFIGRSILDIEWSKMNESFRHKADNVKQRQRDAVFDFTSPVRRVHPSKNRGNVAQDKSGKCIGDATGARSCQFQRTSKDQARKEQTGDLTSVKKHRNSKSFQDEDAKYPFPVGFGKVELSRLSGNPVERSTLRRRSRTRRDHGIRNSTCRESGASVFESSSIKKESQSSRDKQTERKYARKISMPWPGISMPPRKSRIQDDDTATFISAASAVTSSSSNDTIVSWTAAADKISLSPFPTYLREPPVVPVSPLRPRPPPVIDPEKERKKPAGPRGSFENTHPTNPVSATAMILAGGNYSSISAQADMSSAEKMNDKGVQTTCHWNCECIDKIIVEMQRCFLDQRQWMTAAISSTMPQEKITNDSEWTTDDERGP